MELGMLASQIDCETAQAYGVEDHQGVVASNGFFRGILTRSQAT